jgi:hypothetical protein
MSNASDAVFRVDLLLRANLLFYTQLSSIGVFGTEANIGFMHMRHSGKPFHVCENY